jgi:hypothetical protein
MDTSECRTDPDNRPRQIRPDPWASPVITFDRRPALKTLWASTDSYRLVTEMSGEMPGDRTPEKGGRTR